MPALVPPGIVGLYSGFFVHVSYVHRFFFGSFCQFLVSKYAEILRQRNQRQFSKVLCDRQLLHFCGHIAGWITQEPCSLNHWKRPSWWPRIQKIFAAVPGLLHWGRRTCMSPGTATNLFLKIYIQIYRPICWCFYGVVCLFFRGMGRKHSIATVFVLAQSDVNVNPNLLGPPPP